MATPFLVNRLFPAEAHSKLRDALTESGHALASGIVNAAKPFFFSLILQDLSLPALLITATMEKAEDLFNDLQFFLPGDRRKSIVIFPERESDGCTPFLGGEAPDTGLSQQLSVLERISQEKSLLVIAPLRSTLQRIPDRETLNESILTLRQGETCSPEELSSKLQERGYERTLIVEKRGEFSRRGCILDIYPVTGIPARMEFFGDEIESIRELDIETQRSRRLLTALNLLPRKERSSETTLIDYVGKETPVILDEPSHLKLRLLECSGEGSLPSWEELELTLSGRKRLSVSSWTEEGIAFETAALEPFYGKMEDLAEFLKKRQDSDAPTIVVSLQDRRLNEIMDEHGIATVTSDETSEPRGGRVHLFHGKLSEGFSFGDGLIVITDREIGGGLRRPVSFSVEKRQLPVRLEDLTYGDLVVHVLHGIGIYRGLENLAIKGHHKEFIAVEYAKGDKLYVPVEQMDLLQKFTPIESRLMQPSRLGGREWKSTRAKVKAIVRDIAEKLLQLYATRETIEGLAFSPDTPWQSELESSFPYEETADQKKAIDAVKRDMESRKPMDRLICGDAGYGKTEVALRSAFKAVMEGRQVGILVPTTILAEQHYTTFKERLAPFPVRVEMLSRFRSPAEQSRIVEDLREGRVDIVIGTHRLLQGDIEFKSLGLLVIDEEQHFGVVHKERLKELKAHVDALTLTATPIPRTLHFTLSGIRDMSLITTPPENRLPIRTYLFEYSKDILRGAISREIERGGQVYFLHNRVRGIELMAMTIEKLIPRARVVVAHGQMNAERLERIMQEFMEGIYDVLVCTTIIESGIDIPNVNTIIINNAYSFGLAQLYQLRGRVGRSHRQAYSYLLYPPHRKLGIMAMRRMEILKDFSELGAGFHIAMKDLELRGAGNILGTEQHGFVNAVGFDLYCQLLSEAVRELKGEKPEKEFASAQIDLPLSAFLPNDYIPDDRQKLTIYRKMAAIKSREEIHSMEEELRDRFGPIAAEAQSLLGFLHLKVLLFELSIPKMAYEGEDIILYAPFAKKVDAKALKTLGRKEGVPLEYLENRLIIRGILKVPDWLLQLLIFLESLIDAGGL